MTSQPNPQPASGPIPYRPHPQVDESLPARRTVIRGNAIAHTPIESTTEAWSKPPLQTLEQAEHELFMVKKESRSNFVFFLMILGVALVLGAFLAQLLFPESAWDFSNNEPEKPAALHGYVIDGPAPQL